jgi:hypothetical protein
MRLIKYILTFLKDEYHTDKSMFWLRICFIISAGSYIISSIFVIIKFKIL